MIHANEIQNSPGQMQFSVTLVGTVQMRLDSSIAAAEQPISVRPGELALTGSRVLAGCVAAFSAGSVLFWAVIKLWLFEP